MAFLTYSELFALAYGQGLSGGKKGGNHVAKLTAAARKKLPDSSFALPEDRRFPIHDEEHIRLAWSMLKRAKGLSDEKRKAAARAIIKAAKKAGIDTSEWTKQLGVKPATKADEAGDMDDDFEMPTAEDLTIEAIGAMTEAQELCAVWCLIHEEPLSSVQREALKAAVRERANVLQISMWSWDYYDGGRMAEMSEKMAGGAAADAAKAAPTVEGIAGMSALEELRQAYVDVREAALSAEVRDGLESAIRSRCDTLNISFWEWKYRGDTKADEAASTIGADGAQDARFLTDSAAGVDVFVGPSILLDAGDPATGRPMRRRFRVSRANYRNHNNRVYPWDHIADAVRAANEDIAAIRLDPGEMYHPEAYRAPSGAVMFKSAFERQVFKWEKFHLADDGTVYGDAAILEHTPAGAIIAGHLRNGVAVPVSVRWLTPNGLATRTLADGARVEVPNKPLRIKTVDAVPNPAMEDAHDVTALDAAEITRILEAPPQEASSVSGPGATTQNDGAQGAQEEETMDLKQILEALKTPEGQALLKETLGAQFDSVRVAAENWQASQAEQVRKDAVKAVVDGADLSRFNDQTRKVITDAVLKAGTPEQAMTILDTQMALADNMASQMNLARLGYPPGARVGAVRVDSVTEGKPWRSAVDKMKVAFDETARGQGILPDPTMRKLNAAAVAKMIERYEAQNGRALYDAVQAIGDATLTIADDRTLSMADAATTTALVLNQPLVQMAIIEQAFQDMEALQFATVRTDPEGSVFKVPSEYYTPAANAATGDIIVAEQGAIPEANVNLAWLTFSPMWRRIATRLTQDVIRELKAGPARYDVLGRSLYHVPREKARVVDLALYLEMLVTSDEYSAVAVADETQTVQIAGAGGTNVAYVYTLKRGTADGITRAPVVRERQVVDLASGGSKTTTTKNQFVAKVGANTLTRGYLDSTGNIQGGDYAVDWEAGKVYFKTGLGLNPGAATPINPTCSYTYATNFDAFDLTVPNGVEQATYYNRLLQRLDQTAALMGSSPRFKKPNVGIMSLNSATYIENAALFYRFNSPQGTELLAEQTYFGRRNGVNLAKINAPWGAGDNRMLLTQIGATQYGVDVPFEVEGPVQAYVVEGAEVKVKDEKIWYGREHSAIFTPQPTKADGSIINPFNRTVILYKS